MSSPIRGHVGRFVTLLRWATVACWIACTAGCDGGARAGSPVDLSLTERGPLRTVFGGQRPVTLRVPRSYDPATPFPLLLVLHGYGANGWVQETYLGYDTLVETESVLLASPEGTVDKKGKQFWNATDACCDLDGSGVDDAGYLSSLISEIKGVYNVDPGRVYLAGHSNGGFMAYRMACQHAKEIAAIISLAGATYDKEAACSPARPVSVLQIHGDKDTTVDYQGGTITSLGGTHPFPGAVKIMQLWAKYNKCTGSLTAETSRLDLESSIPGAETKVERFGGCPSGIDVRLWTITGGSHMPLLQPTFSTLTWQWLKAHAGP